MRIDRQLKVISAKTDLSISEIGRRLGKTPQAFSQKIKRGSISMDDLYDIALVTGCSVECKFVFFFFLSVDLSL